MRRRARDTDEVFGMSFLDVVSCGFAAMVAILMLSKNSPEPPDLDPTLPIEAPPSVKPDLKRIAELQDSLTSEIVRASELEIRESELGIQLTGLEREIENLTARVTNQAASAARGTMDSQYDGGIPGDATHIVFVIDSSGSMRANWGQVTATVDQLLSIHPKVEAMQVLSDMGDSLIPGYDKRWIPDTPSARKNFNESLASMSAFSNSSPLEGIERALRIYAPKADKLAIYVLGDDFTGGDFESALTSIDQLNTKSGKRVARIHSIGFPWGQGDRFATLMREVAYRNNGVYLGL